MPGLARIDASGNPGLCGRLPPRCAPVVAAQGTGLGAAHGILIKDAAALEDAVKLDVIIFDKTGTLTMGQPKVEQVVPGPGFDEAAVIATAAAIEQGSEHHIAVAVLERAKGLTLPPLTDFASFEGKGVRAVVDGRTVYSGNRMLMEENGNAPSIRGKNNFSTYSNFLKKRLRVRSTGNGWR